MSLRPPDFRGRFDTALDPRRAAGRAAGPIALTPTAVATPTDVADVVTLVRWARGEGHALVPRGAGTGMPGGNVGSGIGVDLVPGFDRLGAVDPEGRTIRVEPGVIAADVEAAARALGLFLPALPSSARRCTIGGMIANNAAGAHSFGYGAIHRWVEALDVVLADGSVVRLESGADLPAPFDGLHAELSPERGPILDGWPRVRKNSSGYALDRFLPREDGVGLLVGSEGTLGVIVSADLRLASAPEEVALVAVSLPDLDALPEVTARARDGGAAACEFFTGSFLDIAKLRVDNPAGLDLRATEALLVVEFHGLRTGSVDDFVDALRGAGRTSVVETDEARRNAVWSMRHAASPMIAKAAGTRRRSTQFIEDSVVPPEALPRYLRELYRILADEAVEAVLFGHAGDANVHVNPLIPVDESGWRERVRRILERTVDLVTELGGTLAGEHGDGRLRAPYLDRIWGPSRSGAFRRTKEVLDPEGTLNPGVVIPVNGQDPLEGLTDDRIA